ncbi:hypothetical protein BD626DRAFT_562863 [Schizophyllum amplum]|uniref:Uncharacterized protein n=1 Tax=Schizophyllum amplum TaxID=97359 RepID=A0A550CW91_9AGAR|nr:hypothetical protein BD626DRAFT_562863 [Auriculariopsis ampla]
MATEVYSHVYHPLAPSDVHDLQIMIMRTGVELLLYGVQMALFVAALSVLMRRKDRPRLTIAAIACLSLFSTIAVVIDVTFLLVRFAAMYRTTVSSFTEKLKLLDVGLAVSFRSNYFISDAVVVWRAWVLWPNNRMAKGVLVGCICGSAVGVIIECVWTLKLDVDIFGYFSFPIYRLMLIMPLLLTNVAATILIGVRFWYHRRFMEGTSSSMSQAEKVIVLLLESGFVYCFFWVVYLVVGVTTGQNRALSAFAIFNAACHNISGIYPTFLVLAVALQRLGAQSPPLRVPPSPHLQFAATREARVRLWVQ